MRKFVFALLSLVLMFPVHSLAASAELNDDQVDKILELSEEQISKDFVMEQLHDIAQNEGISLEEAADAVYEELLNQHKLALEEEKYATQSGGSGGTTVLGSSSKGNIFYETASTAGISHGHVGMYYTTDTLVESMPSSGVRRLARTNKQVDSGARIQTVSGTSSTQKSIAANWANGRVGLDDYSYNFFNNRSTSCYGDKNCSKLVWCAYDLMIGIDLDSNGGLGVYPKDIRDHSSVITLVQY